MTTTEERFYFIVYPRGNRQGLNVVYCTVDQLTYLCPASRYRFSLREQAESHALNIAAHEGLTFPLNIEEYDDYLD